MMEAKSLSLSLNRGFSEADDKREGGSEATGDIFAGVLFAGLRHHCGFVLS